MIAHGFNEDTAVSALTTLLQARLTELKSSKTTPTLTEIPDPLDREWPAILQRPELDLKDQRIEVQLALTRPRIVVFRNFLSAQECDKLIELARQRIEASEVIDMQSGSTRRDEGRTSSGMNFQRAD